MGTSVRVGTTPSSQSDINVTTLVGSGIYPIPEASRLTKVAASRIRRWLDGTENNGLWVGQHKQISDSTVLGFLDLQEVRFVDAFLKAGVKWKILRLAHEIAKERYKTQRPFCTKRFATDGKHIIEQARMDGQMAWDETAFRQKIFPQVVAPFLRDLEFSNDDKLLRWWPLGLKKRVVLDPQRQFGQPLVSSTGIRTEVLHLMVKAGTPAPDVAQWFEVDLEDVIDAVEFETQLAA
jgi:uncharacterized protein (DUF433 family)